MKCDSARAGPGMPFPAKNPSSARHACCQCDRAPSFQGQLRATAAEDSFYLQAEACGNHLGDMVWALKNCAHQRGATQAQLTLLAIDPSSSAGATLPRNTAAGGFAFSSIALIP